MGLTQREYLAYGTILTPTILLVAYLLYCSIAIPIEVNTHRLRYNQLQSFEMYTLTTTLWHEYSMDTEGISIVTYQQQKPYEYKYYLGLFQDDNVTVSNSSISGNISEITWNQFAYLIKENDASTLFIAQWSESECISFQTCFQEHFPTESDYIYTPIMKEHFMNINSKTISDAFDETMDIVCGAVLIILSLILLLLLIAIPSFDNNPTCFLVAIVFIGAYICWVFILSVVPIFFSTPYDMKLDYWSEVRYSLVYTVGDYNPLWWVSGVVLNGIWMYSLLFSCPAMCICFCFVASCSCWCEICSEEKGEDIALGVLVFFVGIGVVGVILETIAFLVIFIANLTFWNITTFNSFDDELVIQTFVALICIWVLLPSIGCIVCLVGKKHNIQIESINSLTATIVNIRSGTMTSGHKYGSVGGEEQDTVAMTEKEEKQHIITH